MGLKHRKLISGEDCRASCNGNGYFNCVEKCKHPRSIIFIAVASSLAAIALLVIYFLYVKYYKNRRRSPSQPQPQQHLPHQEEETLHHHDHHAELFIDEEHGPVVDHPIWYIRTVGLQQSLISSISVCQYKKGDGLIEGTECAVCLSEFQEDETLRLLPKCDHAFHIPCIDTWLTSHTNCPLCRAPIIKTGATDVAPSEPFVAADSSEPAEEETPVEVLENTGESSTSTGGVEDEICDGIIRTTGAGEDYIINKQICINEEEVDDDVEEPRRRSVSMDSASALKISLAVSNVVEVDKSNRGIEIVAKRVGEIRNCQGRKVVLQEGHLYKMENKQFRSRLPGMASSHYAGTSTTVTLLFHCEAFEFLLLVFWSSSICVRHLPKNLMRLSPSSQQHTESFYTL